MNFRSTESLLIEVRLVDFAMQFLQEGPWAISLVVEQACLPPRHSRVTGSKPLAEVRFLDALMFYVYILKNIKKDILYIGYTSNLKRRMSEHKTGKVYTTNRLGKSVELVYYEAYKNEDDAREREKGLKNSGSVYNGLIKRISRSLKA